MIFPGEILMIICLCETYKKTTVSMLEALSFINRQKALLGFSKLSGINEVAILQTCNRTEVYAVVSCPLEQGIGDLVKQWGRTVSISTDIIMNTADIFLDREALTHLLSVASGLESMVVGENQIVGQVRKAYVEAKISGTMGPILEKSFRKAFNLGKKVRAETKINKGLTSISSVAVHFSQRYFAKQAEVKVLLVGAGEAGTIVAQELHKNEKYRVFVANRTFSRGITLAGKTSGKAITIDEIPTYVPIMNMIVTATRTKTPLLKREHFQNIIPKTPKLLILDLSQPRCVEEEVANISCVKLMNLDDIKSFVEKTLQIRKQETKMVESMIEEELNHLQSIINTLVAQPIVSRLCAMAEKVREKEFSYARRKLNNVDEDELKIVEDLTKVLTKRLLQPAIEKLKSASLNSDSSFLSVATKMFNLEQDDEVNREV